MPSTYTISGQDLTPNPANPLLPGEPFLVTGKFQAGANYWASHAGISMWSEWDSGVVDTDLARLAAAGLTLLRVFPLWSDFQPIHALRGFQGQLVEFRHGEAPLPEDEIGQSGVNPVMLRRFEELCDLAARHRLGLIVGLVTGWMSGRLFAPPALEGLNHLTDPASLLWQVRLVSTLVQHLRRHPAIRAWDLGNECNCLAPATREQAWMWTASLANAIRSKDPSRPVISGMHSLAATDSRPWTIRDQGELTDLLTTHPYPLFTPHANREPMNTLRPLLHGTAETRLYADLSGRPAFVEEMGNFGPAFCDEVMAADILRAQIFTLWAHDCRGLLWWCAHDQSHLEKPPYDWIAMERRLGLLRADGSPKPACHALTDALKDLRSLPLETLPPRRVDGVCLLSEGQDQWGAAYSAFVLSRQAGLDIRFCAGDRTLPDSTFYLLPSVCGLNALTRRRELELLERVRAGATLYVSFGDGFLSEILDLAGLHLLGRHARQTPSRFFLGDEEFLVASSTLFHFQAEKATVLAEEDGNPVFTSAAFGKGRVFLLSVPLETTLAETQGAFLPNAAPYWKLYAAAAGEPLSRRHIRRDAPALSITEHPAEDGSLVAVFVNLQPLPLTARLTFSDRHHFTESLLGPEPEDAGQAISLPPLGVAVWRFAASTPTGFI